MVESNATSAATASNEKIATADKIDVEANAEEEVKVDDTPQI